MLLKMCVSENKLLLLLAGRRAVHIKRRDSLLLRKRRMIVIQTERGVSWFELRFRPPSPSAGKIF